MSTALPFVNISTDVAGPLYVKEGSRVKAAYVCVFTCASLRMVYLKLTNGPTTDEFLQTFSCMTNCRGLCQGGRTMQKPSKSQEGRLGSCLTSQSHRASRCGTVWINI